MSSKKLLLTIIVGVMSACSGQPAPSGGGTAIALELLASTDGVPYSDNHFIALTGPDRVCVVDSFDVRVHCADSRWRDVVVIGQAGSGPGEFQRASALVRGPAGILGVIDHGLQRLSAFDSAGVLQFTAAVPFLFRPMAPFDTMILGATSSLPSFAGGTVDVPSGATVQSISLPSGQMAGRMVLAHPSEAGGRTETARGMQPGAVSPTGEVVFLTGDREIARYTADGALLDVFVAPTFKPELPGARDVEEYAGAAFLGARPDQAAILAYSAQPKRYALAGSGSLRMDDHGRLWVMTSRGRDEQSWLDVYDGSTLVATLGIRDRIYGFDLLGTRLAVLVERKDLSEEGLPLRAIDWYEVR